MKNQVSADLIFCAFLWFRFGIFQCKSRDGLPKSLCWFCCLSYIKLSTRHTDVKQAKSSSAISVNISRANLSVARAFYLSRAKHKSHMHPIFLIHSFMPQMNFVTFLISNCRSFVRKIISYKHFPLFLTWICLSKKCDMLMDYGRFITLMPCLFYGFWRLLLEKLVLRGSIAAKSDDNVCVRLKLSHLSKIVS